MSKLDELAKEVLDKHKLPTTSSHRQAFTLGYQSGYYSHKVKLYRHLYGRDPRFIEEALNEGNQNPNPTT